jgi:hypothetical protein
MATHWKQFLLAFTFVSAAIPCFSRIKGSDPTLLGKATAGDAESECRVGQIYAKGERVGQDFTQAAAWYIKAADQGFAQARDTVAVRLSPSCSTRSSGRRSGWGRTRSDGGKFFMNSMKLLVEIY